MNATVETLKKEGNGKVPAGIALSKEEIYKKLNDQVAELGELVEIFSFLEGASQEEGLSGVQDHIEGDGDAAVGLALTLKMVNARLWKLFRELGETAIDLSRL